MLCSKIKMQFFISELTKSGHNTGSVHHMWKQKHNHSPKYFLLYSPDNGLCPQKEFPYNSWYTDIIISKYVNMCSSKHC
jgi:hypothetical protein